MVLQFPPIYLLPTHIPPEELYQIEVSITSLTYDIHEAKIILGRVTKRERAMFELRRAKLDTEPLNSVPNQHQHEGQDGERAPKRQKTSPSLSVGSLDSSDEWDSASRTSGGDDNIVRVLRLSWLTDSLAQDKVLPMKDYLVYEGRKVEQPGPQTPQPKPLQTKNNFSSILLRAAGDAPPGDRPASSAHSHSKRGHGASHAPILLHETTEEHDVPLPALPEFLTTTYSCQRPTPVNTPNKAFVEELKKVRTLRILVGDQVGVRAYSSAIASLAAYPYPLQGPRDVARLPGCGSKIAILYHQWVEEGCLKELVDAGADPKLAVLQLFYDIWGVGDVTAREFYRKGWRDLDDLVEYGWQTLSRVQQIGVKYYDELNLKIPREEVERIASIVQKVARRLDSGYEIIIVGGHRRGKKASGDVDIVISHRDERQTLNFIERLVTKLEQAHYITHTLSLSTKNSERGQRPVPWKGEGGHASGFDTLDKALVVWQNPGQEGAPHRRVDLIISPWKTVGCAVLGWSGGTTFQRDLRRYCKKEMGLKFDSSGVRSRTDGRWVDLEDAGEGPAPDMVAAEKRVFAKLGLPWRPPEERCTG